MIACLLAALMATGSALTLTTAGLLTNSVYRPLAPGRSEAHYVLVGRLFSGVYVIGGLLVAWYFKNVLDLYKFLVMFNCIVAASFWLGMTWRRANPAAAWASIGVTAMLTLVLPLCIPLIPGMRKAPYLQQVTAALPVTRTYHASATDLAERQAAIAKWDALQAAGLAAGARPVPLRQGETFAKTFTLPQKSVFWLQDLGKEHGRTVGVGMLRVELVALRLLGWNLSKNTYSFNETLSMLMRILLPFGVLLLVGLCTRPQEKAHLDHFYARLCTPIYPEPQLDAQAVERTRQELSLDASGKLFPGSAWEWYPWNRRDWSGVLWCSGGALGVIMLLVLVTRIGG